ncbi:hypothetical protein DKX38_006339 [Salix brachista]|uniref:B box-type domain-containing protein n=1 Tax=Salix brachista TaxID=2182728 RepID=A0A5N5N284_9ROSI|nr:hypothetical protein DKX38_006339 [Salix brachista]
MRMLCDVCESGAAILFCAADEAALCRSCDEKVHICNKLASRHVRVGLAEPSDVPRCDICENAPAFFYCEIDGISLCLQCDMIVHVGGKRTHGRYLLLRQRVEFPGDKPVCTEEQGQQLLDHNETRRDQNQSSKLTARENQQNHRASPAPMVENNTDSDGKMDNKKVMNFLVWLLLDSSKGSHKSKQGEKQWNEEVKTTVQLAIYHVCHQAPSLFSTTCNREDNIESLKKTASPKNGFSYRADKLAALLLTIYDVRFQRDALRIDLKPGHVQLVVSEWDIQIKVLQMLGNLSIVYQEQSTDAYKPSETGPACIYTLFDRFCKLWHIEELQLKLIDPFASSHMFLFVDSRMLPEMGAKADGQLDHQGLYLLI